MTRCPHRDVCPFPEMRAPDQGVYHFDTPGIIGRLGRRMHQTTPWPQTQPIVNVQQPPASPGAPLNPGEAAYREMSTRADIWPQLIMALVIGCLATVLCICGWYAVTQARSRFVTIPGAILSAFCLVIFCRLNWDVIWERDDARLVTRKRDAEAQPTAIDGDITIQHKRKQGEQARSQWRYPQIKTPGAGREWLARWFWRIYRQGGVGFSQNVAQSYHIQRGECKGIQDTFVTEGWAERKPDNSVDTLPEGLDIMAEVIREIYPNTHLSPRSADEV